MPVYMVLIIMISVCSIVLVAIFMIRQRRLQTGVTPSAPSAPTAEHSLLELIHRQQFLVGKNFELFEKLLKEHQFDTIEKLLLERFTAQGKDNAAQLAHETTKKIVLTLSEERKKI